ncbi:hypothetical protein V6Z11_D12G203600 [Gossypium hirsutum]
MVETDGILESLLFEWENFNSIASKSEPSQLIKQPRSMVMIRDSLPQSDLSIFPPINHENLHYQIQQQQQNPVSEPSLLPPSGAGDVIQSSVMKTGPLEGHFGLLGGSLTWSSWCYYGGCASGYGGGGAGKRTWNG